jgi:hypothetical protein
MFKMQKQVAPIIEEVRVTKDVIIEESAKRDLEGLVEQEKLQKYIEDLKFQQKEADDLRAKVKLMME